MNYLRLMASVATIATLAIAAPAAAGEKFDEDEARLPQPEKVSRLIQGLKIYNGDKFHGDILRMNQTTGEVMVTTVVRVHGHAENTVTTRRFCVTELNLNLEGFDTTKFRCASPTQPIEFTHTTNGIASRDRALMGGVSSLIGGPGFGLGQALGGLIYDPCADGCGGDITWNVNGGEGGEANAAAQNITDVSNGVQVDSTVSLNGCPNGACGQFPATDPRPPAAHVAPGYRPGQ